MYSKRWQILHFQGAFVIWSQIEVQRKTTLPAGSLSEIKENVKFELKKHKKEKMWNLSLKAKREFSFRNKVYHLPLSANHPCCQKTSRCHQPENERCWTYKCERSQDFEQTPDWENLQDDRLEVLCKDASHHVEGRVGQQQSVPWNGFLSRDRDWEDKPGFSAARVSLRSRPLCQAAISERSPGKAPSSKKLCIVAWVVSENDKVTNNSIISETIQII